MLLKKLYFTLIIVSFVQLTFSQKVPSQRPKLVVFILIDQLSTEQIVAFRDQFSDNGFKRLMNGGAFYRNAYYPAGSAYYGTNIATIATGSYPSIHGIVSDWWYDRVRGKEVNAAYGDINLNNNDANTNEYPTADRLMTSTITDELKWMNNGASRVTAIGFNSNFLVWSGGHSPDYLYKIDDESGEFVIIKQSEAIKPVPDWVKKFNEKQLLNTYSKREWGPLKDLSQYHQMKFFSDERQSSFMYSLENQEGEGSYIPVIHSPYGNKLVRDFAMAQIIHEQYGKDEVPDVLTLHFTTRAVHGKRDGSFNAETEDMLLRLDLEIADLLRTIDNEIGLENTLITLSSVSVPHRDKEEKAKHGIPTGVFNGHKAAALLNLFMMAKYGQGKWVMAYHDTQLYLNHELMKKNGVNIVEAKKEAASFLTDMSGVAYALPISEVQMSSSDIASLPLEFNYHPNRSGDIAIKIRPGWVEELKDGKKVNRNWKATYLPLMFYGWKVKHSNVYQSVSMTRFAPTICSFLEVPFPNGSESEPLPGITF